MANLILTRTWLVALGNTTEGIASALIDQGILLEDLHDVEPEDIKTICQAARRPGGELPNGDPNQGVNVPAMLQLKLMFAVNASQYYETVGRTLSHGIMTWAYVKQFKALSELRKNWPAPPELPKLGRNVPIMKLLEMIRETLRQKLGIRQIPLSYVMRAVVTPGPIGPIRLNKPFSTDFSSFHDKMIARASHDHQNYQDDSSAILDILVGCLGDTEYMTSLKPFMKLRDGRGALLALEIQNLGNSKWDTVIRKAEQTVLNFPWNGKNVKYTLDRHIVAHRAAQNDMVRASEHMTYVPPNEHARVQRLLNSIVSTDVKVISAVTTILADTAKRNDFEEAADFLLLAAPVSVTDENMSHNISAVIEDDRTGFEISPMGKTGIAMRYYPYQEYKALSDEQRQELSEWSRDNGRRHPNLRKKRKREQSKISALRTELNDLKATIAAASTTTEATIAAPFSSNQTPQRNNRTNPALQRVTRPPTQNQVE